MKKSKNGLGLFTIYHLFLITFSLLICLIVPRHISTNFMDVIPHSGIGKGVAKAEKKFSASQDSKVTMFVCAPEFEKAKSDASSFYSRLEKTGLFKELSMESAGFDFNELKQYVSDNAYLLMDRRTQDLIEKDIDGFAMESYAKVYSSFTFSSLSELENDPFLISEEIWMSLLEKVSGLTNIGEKDGVLAVENDGKWYVMLSGTLTEKALNIAKTKGGVQDIFDAGKDYEIYYSGVPFHSFESASKSQREITYITVFSIAAILVLFYLVCKNFHILKLFIISLVLSLTSAFCMLLIFFKDFHVMTLIFGTSLIGTCIDYSIHYYTRYAQLMDNEKVRERLFKSLTIGYVSTVVCYLLLLLSSYPILKQISLFCSAGLTSSYLTSIGLYPKMIKPNMVNTKSVVCRKPTEKKTAYLLYYIAIIFTFVIVLLVPEIGISNDIASLYKPSDRLMEGEAMMAKLSGYADTTYAIIEGADFDDALEKEKNFVQKIDDKATVVAASSYIPVLKERTRSLECAKKLLSKCDEAEQVLQIDTAEFKDKIQNLDVHDMKIPSVLSFISLGYIDDLWYEVAVIRDAENTDEIKQIADTCDGVTYFRTAVDISKQLDELTLKIMCLFAVGFILIVVMLSIMYGIKEGLRISLAPYCVIAGTVLICTLFGFKLDFFFSVGLVLITGLGLDYIVFANDRKGDGSLLAITLSFVTTELSFGSLLFSSFKPVHTFGLTVFVGILIAYICALTGRKK